MENTNNKIICAICGFTTNSLGIPAHLKHNHPEIKNTQDYYDKYMKKENEGICLACGKPTKFKNITKGYKQYCSTSCANHSEIRKEHIATTNINKYGCACVLANKEIIDKRNKTILEKYGANNIYATEYGKQKIKETNLKRYGTESAAQSKEVKQKMKDTCQKKYGVDYVLQSKEFKEASKQTYLVKYGTDHPWKSKELRQKEVDNFCNKNQVIPLNSLKLYDPIKCCEKFNINITSYKNQYFIPNNTNIKELYEYSDILKNALGTSIEKDVEAYLIKLGITDYIMRTFKVIAPKQLDCYIPDKNVAIELNGDYWHSINFKLDKNYHIHKTELCNDKNIYLIHIFENEWNEHQEICKSIIASALGIYDKKIYAKDCSIKEVNSKEAKQFLEENHIHGAANNSIYNLGLYYENELVQIISIGNIRNKNNEYELLRMCSKLYTQIIDGFSTLLNYQPYNECISYIDRSKFNYSTYEKLGFELIDTTKPNYYYVLNNKRIPKVKKCELPKLLGNKFNPNKTEKQNMIDAGYLLLYDCGNYKLKYIKN